MRDISLRTLKASFVKITGNNPRTYRRIGPKRTKDADGVTYLCPLCYQRNGNTSVGTEHVINWFRHRARVTDAWTPGPGRWTPSGTNIDDLTFEYGSPVVAKSVALTGHAHYFIRKGKAVEITSA